MRHRFPSRLRHDIGATVGVGAMMSCTLRMYRQYLYLLPVAGLSSWTILVGELASVLVYGYCCEIRYMLKVKIVMLLTKSKEGDNDNR